MQHRKSRNDALLHAGLLSFLTFAIYFVSASDLYAATQIHTTLCEIWTIVDTDIGPGVATLAVAALGCGAMLGKVSWGLAVTVAVGIAVLFSANSLVTLVDASATSCP